MANMTSQPYYVCGGCGLLYPADAFNAGRPDCRPCQTAASARWIAANRSRFNELARASYRRHAAERIAKHRQWEAKNPDIDREIRARALAKRTPASIAERSARRRARIRENGYEAVDFDAIFERDQGICHLCGQPVARENLHFDHVIPLARGGSHTTDNVRVSHDVCNLKKGAR
jgi:5-methylcytosine-specific restriction endonuclease McrA